ncbi:HAD-IIIC family phosphatase [Nitrospira defluvii]|uniref:Methoxymalonyl-ACP biosynthesis protein FkbH n=1 Tax=Nitrospira defluvii TaxID=330214 RepID=A0ABN7LHB4_9BACT|nr:HAD-IIIC family phosphatase [Nitrospira defluvii]CAE6743137.1 Methoxymalonyl-ACP biosynthesis protein FkbH [Nitrospira defluvii]
MTPNGITPAGQATAGDTPEVRGDTLVRQGLIKEAIQSYLDAVTVPAASSLCLKLARSYDRIGNHSEACRWALSIVDGGDDYTAWQAGWTLFQRNVQHTAWPTARRTKVAIAGSYTTTQLGAMLRLAGARIGIQIDLYESPYGQYQQEIINPASPLYAFAPDIVLLAVHEGDVHLPEFSSDPTREVHTEITRWTTLWTLVSNQSRARIVQHNFVLPCDIPLGHLATRLPGSRYMMTQAVNTGLGQAAGTAVSIVDCERLSALIGKQRWCDPRYWNMSKQAVALDALPLLARHTAAVIAADVGLSRKCLVLDLDNTLWGGVIAEDGLAGIKLGHGAEGEAFVAFQEYLLKLKRKGVILAVCSKNNHADAIQPFERHPEMRLKLHDIALFVANWTSKPENIRSIADTLQIGLDSLVFVDDNPVEREIVRKFLPQVDVLPMPEDPAYYVRTLSQYLLLETASMTAEDSERTAQYQARAHIKALEASASSIEDFYRSLQMQAIVTPFEETQLPRIAQLIGKTNQFNLTTRRHGMSQLEAFVKDTTYVHLALRLRDRYADHGLVSVMIARHDGSTLDIDTWLMSCRVIGRTVEATMLEHLCRRARQLGCTSIRGTYIPTPKNAMAAEAYAKQGFSRLDSTEGVETWTYDLLANGPPTNPFVKSVDFWEQADGQS